MQNCIIVTGAAGYIGSHTTLLLLQAGFSVLALDNLCNSSEKSLERVQQLAKVSASQLRFVQGDIRNKLLLDELFSEHSPRAIIHFAGLKSVTESVTNPLSYYANNVLGSVNLLQCAAKQNIKHFIFSSSATVYGEPAQNPITETAAINPINPYGTSKRMVEQVLEDLAQDNTWHIGILRYFNPVGAHESGLMGEDPKDTPNNIMPYIAQVAIGQRPQLNVFGHDWPTPDGTGIRDYIHVMDLAAAHVAAIQRSLNQSGSFLVNLGTGRGYSVLELVHAFEKASGQKIAYEFTARRPGDIAVCYADPSKAKQILSWQAQRDIHVMCQDTWNWQRQNPKGYRAY